MFESLTKHLPAIENAEGFGNWVVDRESKGTMNDPIKMPYVNYGYPLIADTGISISFISIIVSSLLSASTGLLA